MPNQNLTVILHFVASLAVMGLLAALAAVGTITSAVALPALGLVIGQLLGIQGFALGGQAALTTSTPASSVATPAAPAIVAPSPGASARPT